VDGVDGLLRQAAATVARDFARAGVRPVWPW
jgi:hypothetical protein